MFTGIIETLGTVEKVAREGTNLHFTVSSEISKELKIDQSVSHNGVCLTVVGMDGNSHTVTAIEETLVKTNLNDLLAPIFPIPGFPCLSGPISKTND